MALTRIQKAALVDDGTGNVVVAFGATASIYDVNSGILKTIYSDRNGSTITANPFTVGADGLIKCYIESGPVELRLTYDGDTTVYPDFLAVDDIIVSGAAGMLQFQTIANMVNKIAMNKRTSKINFADYVGQTVHCVWNNSTSKDGGADYTIWELSAYRTFIGNPAWVPDGTGAPNYYGYSHYVGGSTHVAIIKGLKISAYSVGMLPGSTYDNTEAWAKLTQNIANGMTIDFCDGEFRVFDGIAGITSSGADPLNDLAISEALLPAIENKKNITLKNGTVYAADQSISGAKKYFPCTLSLKGCKKINLSGFNLESKGESWGDADSSFPLTKDQRYDVMPHNAGVALLVERCNNIKINGEYRLCGSVAPVYISSSTKIKISGAFSNPASLGYAAYAVDAWVGDTTITGFRHHNTHVSDCAANKESLTRREDSAAVGSSTYSSKGCVIAEDASVKVTVNGGYYADAYANGSARDIGNAFSANACTMVVDCAVVDNCASVGFTGQSVDAVGRLLVSNVEATAIRKTMHQVQETSFGTQEFQYTNCNVTINGTSVWAGDGDRAREHSSIVANMKQATSVVGTISNCQISGSEAIWINDAASYGSLSISNCKITTDGWLCLSNGWGGAGRDLHRGVFIRNCQIQDTSSETNGYVDYTNYDGTAYTYINLVMSNSKLTTTVVRPAYNIVIAGSNLVTNLSGFDEMWNAWSANSYLENGTYPVSYKEQRGLSGSNRRVVFEYPNRVAFKPYAVNDATSATANDVFVVISAVGAAVVNADGNVEQEWYINDTGLTLWSIDARIPAQYVNAYPPLL